VNVGFGLMDSHQLHLTQPGAGWTVMTLENVNLDLSGTAALIDKPLPERASIHEDMCALLGTSADMKELSCAGDAVAVHHLSAKMLSRTVGKRRA
jgi:hypothetical protein